MSKFGSIHVQGCVNDQDPRQYRCQPSQTLSIDSLRPMDQSTHPATTTPPIAHQRLHNRHNIPVPSKKASPPIYQLKITITDIEPPIWRVIQVPSTVLLCCLH